MPAVFARVREYRSAPMSAYRLARAEDYAAGLRLRRPPHKPMSLHGSEVMNYTDSSRKSDIDVADEFWMDRYFAYKPIRDAATLQGIIKRYRSDRNDINLLTPYPDDVGDLDTIAVGVSDYMSGGPIVGVMILHRWITVEPATRGLEVTLDFYVDALYVSRKARGKFYGWGLIAYAVYQAYRDLDHLTRQMRRESQPATLQSRVGGQPLSAAAHLMLESLHFQLDFDYPAHSLDKFKPNAAYKGYVGCEDCID